MPAWTHVNTQVWALSAYSANEILDLSFGFIRWKTVNMNKRGQAMPRDSRAVKKKTAGARTIATQSTATSVNADTADTEKHRHVLTAIRFRSGFSFRTVRHRQAAPRVNPK